MRTGRGKCRCLPKTVESGSIPSRDSCRQGNDPQSLGNEVVFLDDGFAQAPGAEMFRCPDYGLLEIGVFK